MTLIKSSIPLVIATIVYHLGFLDGVDTFTRLLDSLVIAFIIAASAERFIQTLRHSFFPSSDAILTPEKTLNVVPDSTPPKHDYANAIPDESNASDDANDVILPNEAVAPTRQPMSPISTHLSYEESDNVSALMLSPRPTMSFSTPLRRHTMDEWMPPTPQLSPSLSMSSTGSTDLIRLRRTSRVEEMVKQFDGSKRPSYRRYSIGGIAETPKPLIRTRTFGFKPIIGVWEKRIELEERINS